MKKFIVPALASLLFGVVVLTVPGPAPSAHRDTVPDTNTGAEATNPALYAQDTANSTPIPNPTPTATTAPVSAPAASAPVPTQAYTYTPPHYAPLDGGSGTPDNTPVYHYTATPTPELTCDPACHEQPTPSVIPVTNPGPNPVQVAH